MARFRFLGPLLALSLAAGCEAEQSQILLEENAALADHVTQLEAQLAEARARVDALGPAVASLEAAIADVDRTLLDLTAADLQLQLPEVQAAVMNAKQRLSTTRGAAEALAQSLAYE